MSDNVIHIANIKNDNKLISPIETLEDALRCIKDGTISPDKLMVIGLNTEPPVKKKPGRGYQINWFLSNLNNSEIVSLLEVVKQDFINMLMDR